MLAPLRDAPAGDRPEQPLRVRHHVTDDVNGARRPFTLEDGARAFVRREQDRGDAVHLDAVPLLRHAEVTAAQPGLDVCDGNPGDPRGACSGECRVRVPVDEDDIRALRADDLLERGLHRLDGGRPQVEAVSGLIQPELLEEDLRELAVEVLPRVDDDLVDPLGAQRDRERCALDELRPVAGDGEELQRRLVHPVQRSASGRPSRSSCHRGRRGRGLPARAERMAEHESLDGSAAVRWLFRRASASR